MMVTGPNPDSLGFAICPSSDLSLDSHLFTFILEVVFFSVQFVGLLRSKDNLKKVIS